jgi:hypothetical protein
MTAVLHELDGTVPARASRRHGRWPDAAAVLWLVAVAVVGLAPTLSRGSVLGPYDLVATWGLGKVPGVVPHNTLSGDQISQFVPWATLAWKEVHAGHLPLWNPFNGLGGPLAFNFQSAAFSFPMLVAYLFPVKLVYTVYVLVKIVVAGTGVYFLARVVGAGPLAAALGGTIFELSGAFAGWAGWPMTTVLCMLGWTLGAGVLVVRHRGRLRDIALLAGSVALAAYGGHPESLGILLVATTVFMIPVLLAERHRLGSGATVVRPILALGGATLAGLALAAPLLLPGAQVIQGSVHTGRTGYQALPPHTLANLAFSGWDGFPTANSQYSGSANYYETAAFVGLIALVLGALAIASRWRRPEIRGLALGVVVLSAPVWIGPVAHLLSSVSLFKLVVWSRSLIALDGFLAVLAAVGLQTMLDRDLEGRTTRRFTVLSGVGGAAIGVLWLVNLGGHGRSHTIRLDSFRWPAVSVGALAVSVALVWWRRRRAGRPDGAPRWIAPAVAAILTAAEVSFLLTAAPHVWSSSDQSFVATPAEVALAQAIGSERVGFEDCSSVSGQSPEGILVEANDAYGVAEMEQYEAVLPTRNLTTYGRLTGRKVNAPSNGLFCPSLPTAALARDYGVAFVLAPPGAPGPAGSVPAGSIGDEQLYGIPGAGVLTLQPVGSPADDPAAIVIPVSEANLSDVSVPIDAPSASVLQLHIANYPGWHATLDGHRLALRSYLGDELEATVPPGHHRLTLTYRPGLFDQGVALAGLVLLGFALGGAVVVVRRRRRSAALRRWPTRPSVEPSGAPVGADGDGPGTDSPPVPTTVGPGRSDPAEPSGPEPDLTASPADPVSVSGSAEGTPASG